MTTEQIVVITIQIIIAVLIVWLTASINIKIKFAATAIEAKADAIDIFKSVLVLLLIFVSLAILLYDLFSPAALTKESLRMILVEFFAVITSLNLVIFRAFLNVINKIIAALDSMNNSMKFLSPGKS